MPAKTAAKAVPARFASQPRVAVPGSDKQPIESTDATPVRLLAARSTPPAGGARITVSVMLKAKKVLNPKTLGKPGTRMTRAQFAAAYGPDPASLRLVKAFAAEYGFTLDLTPGGPTTVQLTGSQAAMQKAFGVELKPHTLDDKTYRVREGEIFIPQELAGHITAVLGLDNRPQAAAQMRVAPAAANISFTPVQVATLYGFPTNLKATGQTIAIIELGGGYRTADLTAYFKTLGQTAPTVTAVLVDKGKNAPTTASSADSEVMLDIEVSAAVAPGAKVAVYFAPNTDQGFIDAISTAIHDTRNKPSVISISWGAPESQWTQQSMTALDTACQAAAVLGVTITAAAGDNGSSDGVTTDTLNHVDFPASSPHVLACGGTKLIGAGSTIASEVVWNETATKQGATGGGVSNVFPLPAWQKNANVPKPTVAAGGRGVPDVSGDADPATGYTVRVDGQTFAIGGTSAVAPLWAGLIALANAQNKVAAGFINPTLYAAASKKAFRDITSGNNGAFAAGPGWDACTGLGSPVGSAIIAAVKPAAAAKKSA